jgi:sporulation protein YlmC with PRC-barrel domain
MGVTVKELSEMFGKDVFTNKGAYCGKIIDLDINLQKFRVRSLVVESAKGSFLATMVGGKKGVVVPYQYVDSVGDVVIIKHFTTPSMPEESAETQSAPASMF